MDTMARIEELCFRRGWTIYRLAKEAGLSQSTLSCKAGCDYNPRFATIEKCCRAFGITITEFFNDELLDDEFSLEERRFIADWRDLTPEMKITVEKLMEVLAQD